MYTLSYFKRAILSPHLEKTNISLVRYMCFYHIGYFWKYNLFDSDTFLFLLNSDHLLESWLYFYFYLHGKYQYSHYWYVCIIRKVFHPYLAVMLFSVYFPFDICNSVIIRSMYLFSSYLMYVYQSGKFLYIQIARMNEMLMFSWKRYWKN